MRLFSTLVLFVLVCTPVLHASAENLQRSYEPNSYLRQDLEKKGISIEKWRFCEAIRRLDTEQVFKSLSEGADPNGTCDVIGGSSIPALFLALSRSGAKTEIVSALIGKGANVNARYTPTFGKGSFFMNMIDATQNADYFPLYYAANYTNPEVVELLIHLGADITYRTSVHGATALFPVTEIEIAKVLLKHGVKINDLDANGRTVLRKIKQDTLSQLSEKHHLRPKIEAYVAWLVSQGAHE